MLRKRAEHMDASGRCSSLHKISCTAGAVQHMAQRPHHRTATPGKGRPPHHVRRSGRDSHGRFKRKKPRRVSGRAFASIGGCGDALPSELVPNLSIGNQHICRQYLPTSISLGPIFSSCVRASAAGGSSHLCNHARATALAGDTHLTPNQAARISIATRSEDSSAPSTPRLPVAVCSPQKCIRPVGSAIVGARVDTCPGPKTAQAPAL